MHIVGASNELYKFWKFSELRRHIAKKQRKSVARFKC